MGGWLRQQLRRSRAVRVLVQTERRARERWRGACRRSAIDLGDSERPWRFPQTVQIEPTSNCNLSCVSCSHAREAGRGRNLAAAELLAVVDRLPFRPRSVILSGVGEPLINPAFFEMVDGLAECGIDCDLYTNGTLLNGRKRRGVLSRSNIVNIAISCDSARKEVFESLRVGADFERWLESVGQLNIEARATPGAPWTSMFTVLSKQNFDEMENIVRFAARLGFRGLAIFDPIPVDEVTALMCPSDAQYFSLDSAHLRKLGRSVGLDVRCWGRRLRKPPTVRVRCMQPWDYVFFRADGNVAPCHALFGSDDAAVMGNIHERDFDEIWHGEEFRRFRRTSVEGTNAHCRICPYY